MSVINIKARDFSSNSVIYTKLCVGASKRSVTSLSSTLKAKVVNITQQRRGFTMFLDSLNIYIQDKQKQDKRS
ncbi:hypothetical protein M5689_003831 [Euphorbia peplus]|nr:hypothetical protein M5689_003831 [Euphorbia peplus]